MGEIIIDTETTGLDLVDTLVLARRKHACGHNTLDDLCSRYGVDRSRRSKHGALPRPTSN